MFANTFSALFADYWSRRMQVIHSRVDVFRAIANFEQQAVLKNGDVVHKPYHTVPSVASYTRGTAVTVNDQTVTDESLTVDQAFVAPFYVDDLDALQSNYPVLNKLADEAAIRLSNKIDGDILGEYDQATDTVDDGDLGGTAGNGLTLSVTNVQKVFAIAQRKLMKQLNSNFKRGDCFAVISPNFYQTLLEYLAGKETTLGDSSGVSGHVGQYYGFDLYVSNSVGWSASMPVATIPVAGDTVVINGVTLTAAADASATAAGEYSIETTNDLAMANLVLLINGTGTAGADEYIDVTAANRALLFGITATYTAGTDLLELKAEGWAGVVVSETMTPAANIWTTTKQIEHQLFGKKGAIDVVIQARPTIEVKEVPDKLGKNIIPYTLYGKKTFIKGKDMLIDVQTRSDAY